jgi:hypothetical protein
MFLDDARRDPSGPIGRSYDDFRKCFERAFVPGDERTMPGTFRRRDERSRRPCHRGKATNNLARPRNAQPQPRHDSRPRNTPNTRKRRADDRADHSVIVSDFFRVFGVFCGQSPVSIEIFAPRADSKCWLHLVCNPRRSRQSGGGPSDSTSGGPKTVNGARRRFIQRVHSRQ